MRIDHVVLWVEAFYFKDLDGNVLEARYYGVDANSAS